MKNIFLTSIFVGILLFLPTHSATANITTPDFDADKDGVIDNPPWVSNELVSAGTYYGVPAAHFLPDSMKINPLSSLSQVFWLGIDSKTLSFDVYISLVESGKFKAALRYPNSEVSLVDTVDGTNFYTISSDGTPSGDKELDVSKLGGQWVELVFNLYDDNKDFDTEAWLYNLDISKNVPVVPVLGAAALGGIGVAFVGWLRRRRTL